eukprot:12264890-Alexandrium_andersonii.AAC.1
MHKGECWYKGKQKGCGKGRNVRGLTAAPEAGASSSSSTAPPLSSVGMVLRAPPADGPWRMAITSAVAAIESPGFELISIDSGSDEHMCPPGFAEGGNGTGQRS